MASRRLSTPAFALICAIAVALAVLILVVAGARIDTGVPQPEEMTAEQSARQDLAIELTKLSDISSTTYPDLSEAATSYTDQIGGIWVPWPGGAPDGATNPPLDLSVPSSPTREDVAAQAQVVISQLEVALASASQEDAPLYASMLLGLIAHHPTGAQFTATPLEAEDLALIVSDSATIERFDVARQWFETAAARQEGDARERSDAYRAHLDSLVSHMLDEGGVDSRQHIAALPEWFYADPDPARLGSDAATMVIDHFVTLSGRVATDRRDDIVATAAQFIPALLTLPTYPGLATETP